LINLYQKDSYMQLDLKKLRQVQHKQMTKFWKKY